MACIRAFIVSLAACCCLQAPAQTAPADGSPNAGTVPATQASEQASEQAPAAAEVGRLAARQVPRLRIRWSCDPCELNAKVPPLIEISYAEEAARQGYTLSGAETAEIVLTDFRQRPPAVRATLGLFAGKDRLGGRISFRGQTQGVGDYSANAIYGMNALAASVGKQSYLRVLAVLQAGGSAGGQRSDDVPPAGSPPEPKLQEPGRH